MLYILNKKKEGETKKCACAIWEKTVHGSKAITLFTVSHVF